MQPIEFEHCVYFCATKILPMKLLFASFLLFISALSVAQPNTGGGDFDSKADKSRMNMTNALKRAWNVNDSIRFIPAYDQYCKWDTENIHTYNFNIAEFTDTAMINLRDKPGDFSHPCPGHVTSDFGMRGSRYHYGIDLKLEVGDPVKVAFDGLVRISQYSKTYGHVIVVRHPNGLETLYAHLSKRMAEPGEIVEAGDILGLGGNTGRSYGSHLHFECRYLGQPMDPKLVINFEEQDLVADQLAISKTTFKYVTEARAVKYHTVKKGENLSVIANRYGTTVRGLCKLNGIKQTSVIRPGQKLRYK